ncbi:glycoside hydrolase family 15 protein [Luteibacter sp. PPL201]|uniref:Glycoside hydrolase family 15 protein n=1 Tax=Luteibacter sahnii TaxID=3021977 RepID=A0ABT6BCR2_9GAMM
MAPRFFATHRTDGYLPIEAYGVLGDGRTVALSGADGAVDWWCVPNMDSPPLFDRLLDAEQGGYFALSPRDVVRVERRYRQHSNVLETTVHTQHGVARITESLNSGTAGRLPWEELARRIEGLEGSVTFDLQLRFGRQADHANPYLARQGSQTVFHVGRVLGVVVASGGIDLSHMDDDGLVTDVTVTAGEREVVAIVAGQDEPLIVPDIERIDARIDTSDDEWRRWADQLQAKGPHRDALIRHALALKLLLYAPTGAIAAAGTTSLPEAIGGRLNYDYRYAWVRDASYTIKAFSRLGAHAEAKAAFTWLVNRLRDSDGDLFFTLDGSPPADVREIDMPGYRHSRPVVTGNQVVHQHQHGVYGDIMETAARFVKHGNVLDAETAAILSRLADQCADAWRQKDSGIWELTERQHYTMSKISAWQALARAVELADGGYLPTTCRERWARERDRVAAWIETHCWSEALQAFEMYPGSGQLDASLALAVRFRFDGHERLRKTMLAIERQLGDGAFHFRYSKVRGKEGCFLACTFWMAEAWHLLGEQRKAETTLHDVLDALSGGPGTLAEMVDPASRAWLGNVPQGLSHLAAVHGILTVMGVDL